MAALGLKNPRMHNSITASAKRSRDLFFGFSHIPAGFCTVASGSCWRGAIIQRHHYTMKPHELGSA